MNTLLSLLNNRLILRVFIGLLSLALFALTAGSGLYVLVYKYKENAKNHVDSYIKLSNEIFTDIDKALSFLNSPPADTCTDELLYKMRTALYQSNYIKDIGFSEGNRLICTTGLGVFDEPFEEPPPHFSTSDGKDMWVNVPILLFGFMQTGTVSKQGNFNTVINSDEFRNSPDPNYRDAILIRQDSKTITLLVGDKSLIPPMEQVNSTWVDLSGFYAYSCSPSSIICAASHISFQKVFQVEKILTYGILALSVITSVLFGIYIKILLKNMMKFENRLMRNLSESKIICCYQPVMNLEDNTVAGCEVLTRWQDSDGGFVSPDKFLKTVKLKHKTEYFTSIVISKAFDELAELIRENQTFKLAFNIFPVDFNYDSIQTVLERYHKRYPDLKINIELTEDELIEAPEIAKHIRRLRETGYIVSIDDFGTGYSSLSYLQDIVVDYIKIDRSFVKDMEIGTVKSQLIPHIVSIAKTINAGVIVEGIENESQLIYMKGLGIKLAQGYYFSRPMPVADFVDYYNMHKKK